ncbi:hypothetical protein [Leucobacter aridicollis]|uniref:hypothetical protein n=1 Tax=Leucobacter aridicollis TaxID=283878 RepID=UPI0021052E7C|nr:hypothetical protein [Leucobacter aridicollis]UTX51896.1 hypothetical protein KI794_08885 [Leucobacter aridicollis]
MDSNLSGSLPDDPSVPRPEGSGTVGDKPAPLVGDHPWLATGYISRAARVAAYTLCVWGIWIGANLILLGPGQGFWVISSPSFALAALLFPPVFFAAVAAAMQPWLTQFVPFTQSLLFGGAAYVAAVLLVAIVSVVEAIGSEPCPPGDVCAPGVWFNIGVSAFMFLPAILIAGIGYGLALASVTPRGGRVFLVTLGATLLVAAVVAVSAIAPFIGGGYGNQGQPPGSVWE